MKISCRILNDCYGFGFGYVGGYSSPYYYMRIYKIHIMFILKKRRFFE